ncbi:MULTISPECIES: FAD-dependent oxidoreductase [unclassified Marinovum]
MMHVVIAGAGPTGLTAAVELARLGARVTTLEKRPGPSHLSRAVGLQARSIDILRPSGVADAILAEAVAFTGASFHLRAQEVARLPLGFDDASRLWGLAQDRTETHLETALTHYGEIVRYGVEFLGVSQSEDSVLVETADGTLEADYLIGADGAHSAVRAAMGFEFPGFDLPNLWSIADVDAEGWRDPTRFQAFLLDQGDILVVVPLEEGRFRIISSREDALAALPVKMDVRRVRRRGTFTISVRQVKQYQQGRVFLAGDAAHCHSPVGGRGMNLGIADAADLAQRIIDGRTDGYTAARHPEGAKVIRLSERGRKMLNSDSSLRRGLALRALRLAAAFPPLGRAMTRRLASG